MSCPRTCCRPCYALHAGRYRVALRAAQPAVLHWNRSVSTAGLCCHVRKCGWPDHGPGTEPGTEAALAPPQLVNCGLSDVTVRALEQRGITALFPIQKHVFEPARAGKDLIGRARTGSGKTLAFSLPVIEELLKARPSRLAIQLPGRGVTLPQSCRRKMECGWNIQHEHAPAALRTAAGPSVAVLQVSENCPPVQSRMTGKWKASGRGCM